MKAAMLLMIVGDVIKLVQSLNLISPTGDFIPPTPAQDVQLAVGVENILKAHGINVPAKVDMIIQMIPLIIALVG